MPTVSRTKRADACVLVRRRYAAAYCAPKSVKPTAKLKIMSALWLRNLAALTRDSLDVKPSSEETPLIALDIAEAKGRILWRLRIEALRLQLDKPPRMNNRNRLQWMSGRSFPSNRQTGSQVTRAFRESLTGCRGTRREQGIDRCRNSRFGLCLGHPS